MKTLIASLSLAVAILALPSPAEAQRGQRVLTIYGSDKCPTSNGEEIVVCQRLPEGERYRIPEALRTPGSSLQPTWNEKAKSLEYVGASGVNSCSTVGPGGATGCFREMMRQARAERKAAAQGER